MQTTQIFLRSTDKNIKVRGVLLAYIPSAEFVRHFCSLCQDIRSEYTYVYTLYSSCVLATEPRPRINQMNTRYTHIYFQTISYVDFQSLNLSCIPRASRLRSISFLRILRHRNQKVQVLHQKYEGRGDRVGDS